MSRQVWIGGGWVDLTPEGGGGDTGLTAATQVVDVWNGSNCARQASDGSAFVVAGASYTDSIDSTVAGARITAGIRVPGLIIPKDATITTATLTLTSQAGSPVDDLSVNVTAQASDDAPTFWATASVLAASRTRGSATPVAWTATDVAATTSTTSPNLAAVVQEVVDRSGWTPGNAICFFLDPQGAAARTFRFYNGRSAQDYTESHQAYMPRFTVSWTA